MTRRAGHVHDTSRRLGPQHVAPLIAVADLTGKLASGLSMRFFSLYFWRELGLPPTVPTHTSELPSHYRAT